VRFRPRVEELERRLVPSFSAPHLYTAGPFPRSVALGDFNGDGALDIVTANDGTANTVSVLLNNGDGTFQPPVNYPVGNQPQQVVVGDFNGDGNLDLATANFNSNDVTILLGNGDGTFRPGVTLPVAKNPRALAVGDFNGDGSPDLVVACSDGYQTENADVWLGNGDGTFRVSQRIPFNGFVSGPLSVVVGDFNGDGLQDFATANLGYVVSRFQGKGDGTFLPRVDYPSGHLDAQITSSADFNGDGILDLAVSGSNYGTFTILPGVGNGTFQSPIGSNDFAGSVWAEVGDFNRDGKPDLAVLNEGGDSVGVRLGNGDFTFQAAQTYPVGPGPGAHATSLAVGDVYGDGYPDIIVADRSFDYVAVLRNIPDANHFAVDVPSTGVAGSPFTVTVTALNPLGNRAANYTGKIHFTSSDSQAVLPADYTFTAADQGRHTFAVTLKTAGSQSITTTDVAAGSITGSGSVTITAAAASRLLVAGFPSPVTAGTVHTFTVTAKDPYGNTAPNYAGTAHFTSSDPQAIVPEDYPFTAADHGSQVFGAVLRTAGLQSLTATDTATLTLTGMQSGIQVNPAAASHLDLSAPASVSAGSALALKVSVKDALGNTVTGYRGTIHLGSSDPLAVVPPDYTFTAADNGVHTFTITLNTPGNQTITAADTSTGIRGSVGVAVIPVLFRPPVNYNVGAMPYYVATADLTGDGILDLVTPNLGDNTVSVLLGNGDGTFKALPNFGLDGGPYNVAVGDFNGDGIPDLAVTNFYSGKVSILLGNGDGTFRFLTAYATGADASGVAAADFNGDGILDLVVGNSISGYVSVLLGNGDGTFRSPMNYSAGTFPGAVQVGDFNGDGSPDLAVVNGGSDSVTIFLNNGDGTFHLQGSYATGSTPNSVAAADLNGDGAPDLAVINYLGGSVSVLLGNGDGTFRNAVNYSVGQNPHNVTWGDVDNDGIPDLITANAGANTVSVLLGNGDGTFQSALSFAAGQTPRAVTVGDFNDDGLLDLAVANGGSNNVSVLLHGAVAPANRVRVPTNAARSASKAESELSRAWPVWQASPVQQRSPATELPGRNPPMMAVSASSRESLPSRTPQTQFTGLELAERVRVQAAFSEPEIDSALELLEQAGLL
jgi:hypothetical protein